MLPRSGYVGLTSDETKINRKAVASIPNVTLIPFNLMLTEKRTQFVLKTHLPLMLLLLGDVLFYLLKVGLDHRKIRVAALPFEIHELATFLLQPKIRDALQLFHPFSLCDRTAKPSKQMHMIFRTAGDDRGTAKLSRDAAKICV